MPFSPPSGPSGISVPTGFGNHEIEASPSEALDIIVRYLRYVAKERPDELRQVASEWMTKMTDAITGVIKEAEEVEGQ